MARIEQDGARGDASGHLPLRERRKRMAERAAHRAHQALHLGIRQCVNAPCDVKGASARQIGMYLVHTLFGQSFTRTGHVFNRDRTTVRHACARIENARDRRAFAERLARLEPALRNWADRFAAASLDEHEEQS